MSQKRALFRRRASLEAALEIQQKERPFRCFYAGQTKMRQDPPTGSVR
jgi:hypothetical protein